MPTETQGRGSQRVDCCATVALTTLDGSAPSTVGGRPSRHKEEKECAPTPVITGGASHNDAHEIDGLSTVRTLLGARGVSNEGTEIILASWKPGTERQYRTHITRWSQFCSRGDINPLTPSVADILNFLTQIFHRGVGYQSVNTARGALSALGIVVEGCRAGNHPLVNRFLRGVFNLRPSTPRYAATWDARVVLQRMRDMDPLQELSLQDLSLKLVMLMALTLVARVQTLHLLMLKNIVFGEKFVDVWLGDNIKQCRPMFNIQTIRFTAYDKDERLCVIKTLKEYIKRTEELRTGSGNVDGKLLISYIKPHRSISKDTVARWLKKMLAKCGIDTKMFTAGSVRPASASMAQTQSVPIATIMAKAGWTRETTFARHYNKHIISDTDHFQEAVLGSV